MDKKTKELNKNSTRDSSVKQIFYTDGSGNLYNGKRRTEFGYYSVFHENENKKRIYKEPEITSNVAEIMGVLKAVAISIVRGFKLIEVRTDSQNVIKWLFGRKLEFKTNLPRQGQNIWSSINKRISYFIDILCKNIVQYLDYFELNWIPRYLNKAHGTERIVHKTYKHNCDECKIIFYDERTDMEHCSVNNGLILCKNCE